MKWWNWVVVLRMARLLADDSSGEGGGEDADGAGLVKVCWRLGKFAWRMRELFRVLEKYVGSVTS